MRALAFRTALLGFVATLSLFTAGTAHAVEPVNKTLFGTAVDGYFCFVCDTVEGLLERLGTLCD